MMPNEIGGVDLVRMMSKLADYEINELLVEAGSKLSGSLIREGLVDELVIYLAPCLIGDSAQGMMSLPELENLSDKKALTIRDLRMIGTDIRISARLR
jgi:diaminohydroxyphosphoribosylaminopyrimidine deaminase/5-amino-6-(5-phosphoribosylamino)uracil reductase